MFLPFFIPPEFSNSHSTGPSQGPSLPWLSRACALLNLLVWSAGAGFGDAAVAAREVFSAEPRLCPPARVPFSGSRVAGPSSAAAICVAPLWPRLRPRSTLRLPGLRRSCQRVPAANDLPSSGRQESPARLMGGSLGGANAGSPLSVGDTRPKDKKNLKHRKRGKRWKRVTHAGPQSP